MNNAIQISWKKGFGQIGGSSPTVRTSSASLLEQMMLWVALPKGLGKRARKEVYKSRDSR
eukprot:4580948-Pyramimonas_sp.AAC.1